MFDVHAIPRGESAYAIEWEDRNTSDHVQRVSVGSSCGEEEWNFRAEGLSGAMGSSLGAFSGSASRRELAVKLPVNK